MISLFVDCAFNSSVALVCPNFGEVVMRRGELKLGYISKLEIKVNGIHENSKKRKNFSP